MFEMWDDKEGKEMYMLFDRRIDPFEMANVAGDNRRLVKEMRAEVARLGKKFNAT